MEAAAKLIELYFQYFIVGAIGLIALIDAGTPGGIFDRIGRMVRRQRLNNATGAEGREQEDEQDEKGAEEAPIWTSGLAIGVILCIGFGMLISSLTYFIFQPLHIQIISRVECSDAARVEIIEAEKKMCLVEEVENKRLSKVEKAKIVGKEMDGCSDAPQRKVGNKLLPSFDSYCEKIQGRSINPSPNVGDYIKPLMSWIPGFALVRDDGTDSVYFTHLAELVKFGIDDENGKYSQIFDYLDKASDIAEAVIIAVMMFVLKPPLTGLYSILRGQFNVRGVDILLLPLEYLIYRVVPFVLVYFLAFNSYWSTEVRYHEKAVASRIWHAEHDTAELKRQLLYFDMPAVPVKSLSPNTGSGATKSASNE